MNMTDRRHGDGDDDASKKPIALKPEMSKLSPLAPTPRQTKHWAKQYRTSIATLSSSVLSTFVAVSVSDLPIMTIEVNMLMRI